MLKTEKSSHSIFSTIKFLRSITSNCVIELSGISSMDCMPQNAFPDDMKLFYGLLRVMPIPSISTLCESLLNIQARHISKAKSMVSLPAIHLGKTHQIYGISSYMIGKPHSGTFLMLKPIILKRRFIPASFQLNWSNDVFWL